MAYLKNDNYFLKVAKEYNNPVYKVIISDINNRMSAITIINILFIARPNKYIDRVNN